MRPAWTAVAATLLAIAAGCLGPANRPLDGTSGPPASDRPAPALPAVGLELLVDGLEAPIFVAQPEAGGPFYVAQQGGRIQRWDGEGLTPWLDLRERITAGGERGLLGLAFEPGTQRFVVHYTDRSGDSAVALFEGPGREVGVILRVDQPDLPNHKGGMVAFGPDGNLYVALGDGGGGGDPYGNAQDRDSLLGKILRVGLPAPGCPSGCTATIPDGNPHKGGDGAAEVWALGLRNPWRFSFDRLTGDLWIGDVGQEGWEEVDHGPRGQGGRNYGWNAYEGSHPYSGRLVRGAVPPVWEYPRDDGNQAVTGGYVYRGAAIPQLNGTYVYGDYGSGRIWGLRMEEGEWRNGLLMDTEHAISSFGEDAAGELYVVDHGGAVHRIVAK